MNRRNFISTLGAGFVAGAAAQLLIPQDKIAEVPKKLGTEDAFAAFANRPTFPREVEFIGWEFHRDRDESFVLQGDPKLPLCMRLHESTSAVVAVKGLVPLPLAATKMLIEISTGEQRFPRWHVVYGVPVYWWGCSIVTLIWLHLPTPHEAAGAHQINLIGELVRDDVAYATFQANKQFPGFSLS